MNFGILTAMSFLFFTLLSVPAITVQPLVDPDVLEPSVRNEVEHALAKAGGVDSKPSRGLLPFPTNGMSRTDLAIRLVSTQRADGRWFVGTNDVTAVSVEMLRSL